MFTFGHSHLPIEEVLTLIHSAGISCVADVRAVPRSARFPHFNQDRLREAFNAQHVTYHWVGRALGGRRSPRPDSPHVALLDAVRGFADHMDTPDFERGIAQLLNLAQHEPTAIMCAESLSEHCHRRLIADALVLRGVCVVHLGNGQLPREHRLSGEARRESTSLIYDRNTTGSLDLQ